MSHSIILFEQGRLWTVALRRRFARTHLRVCKLEDLDHLARALQDNPQTAAMLALDRTTLVAGAELVSRAHLGREERCLVVALGPADGRSAVGWNRQSSCFLELGATYVTHSIREVAAVANLLQQQPAIHTAREGTDASYLRLPWGPPADLSGRG